jgi:asparagine synthase (glutamine-hydrolysing)
MCGIIGNIGKVNQTVFKDALHRLMHRGPDGFGIWQSEDSQVTLGHRRLAIIDTSEAGKQPMEDECQVITYNGEIYNYIELRNELIGKGHSFHSKCDTEVIVKAYLEWGADCLKRFNGMWAFAIWNKQKKELFISRDRFGVKPLFYAYSKAGFSFASEMKAIAPLLDEIQISKSFEWCKNNMYNYETTDICLIEGIQRFPAGSYAYIRLGEEPVKPVKFWNTLDNIVIENRSYADQVEHFRSLFLDSCKIRMRSDVKIGTSLSGGLDSSSVAAAMSFCAKTASQKSILPPEWQNAFIASFPGTELDETKYAQAVVESLNLKGHFHEMNGEFGFEKLEAYMWICEELLTTSPVPMIDIYRLTKSKGVTVSLDGHGADELLSGYGAMVLDIIKDVPFDFSSIREVSQTFNDLRGTDKSSIELLIDSFGGRKNLLAFYTGKILNKRPKDELVERLGYFNATLYREFHYNILPTLLRNYDRYSMAAGVEVRMPFMDYRLVTHCFSLPWQSKLNGGYTKAILRDAIQPYLIEEVVRRKVKVGFGTPFTQWLSNSWKEYILDNINSQSFSQSMVVDSKEVKSKVMNFYSKLNPTFEDGQQVWKAIMPYLWEISFFSNLKNVSSGNVSTPLLKGI